MIHKLSSAESRVRLIVLASVASALALLALIAAPQALASEVHVLSKVFGAGELSLGARSGVAVNVKTGEVYVADTGNSRIAKYTAAGVPDGDLATIVAPSFLAVDNSGGASKGDVYVVDASNGSIAKIDPSGMAVATWATGGRLEALGEIAGIATDGSGDLWVFNTEALMREFSQTGVEIAHFTAEREPGAPIGVSPHGISIDAAGDLYVVRGQEEVNKYSATGELLITSVAEASSVSALAANAVSGNAYLGRESRVTIATPAGGEKETFGAGEGSLAGISGIAVVANEDAYVVNPGVGAIDLFTVAEVEPPTVAIAPPDSISGTAAHLTGEVDPGGFPTTCEFEIVSDEQFDQSEFQGPSTVPCSASPGSGSALVPVEASAEGLAPGTKYHVRLAATNAGGSSVTPEPNPIFTTDAVAPVIQGEFVVGVGDTEATVGAKLDPGGAPTTYKFQLVDEAEFQAHGFEGAATITTPLAGPLPSDNQSHEVAATISGLTPATSYRFRVLATNLVTTVPGLGSTFETRTTPMPLSGVCPNQAFRVDGGEFLPDCRAYEQVTPQDKGGLNIEGYGDLLNSGPDGSSVTWFSAGGSGIPAAGGSRREVTLMGSFLTGEAWSTQRLMPEEGLGRKVHILGVSSNQKFALAEAGEINLGARAGLFLIDTEAGTTLQIVSYQSEAPIGSAFADDAITSNGSRVFFESEAQLLPVATPGRTNLYMWDRASNGISLVGVLPDGTAPSGGTFGGAYAWARGGGFENLEEGGATGGNYVEAINAVSEDADQVYFTAGETAQLYLRLGLNGGAPSTVRVSEPNEGVVDPFVEAEGLEGRIPAAFQEATSDGSRAFFTSTQKLTENASTGEFDQGKDLYRYNRASGEVVDVTSDPNDPVNPNGAEVLGLLGTSSDGSSGYFAARGALAAGATPGGQNIYRFAETAPGDFATAYIATVGGELCNQDSSANNWSPSGYCAVKGSGITGTYVGKTSRVTPDGRQLLYVAAGSRGVLEAWLYSSESGESICISCDGAGATPAGPAELTTSTLNANALIAPRIPAGHLTRNLSDDGSRVFFQTPDTLIAADHNGMPNCHYLQHRAVGQPAIPTCMDVYEWEAPRAPGGSCTKAEINGGCLYLISTGTSNSGSYFVDASANGQNAFIATDSQLVPVDRDELYDVYDARVDGGKAAQYQLPAAPCLGEACRGSTAQTGTTTSPGSSSFTGPGNPAIKKHKTCHRGSAKCGKSKKRRGNKKTNKHDGHSKHQHRKHRHAGSSKGGKK
jgi:NHL repeat